MNRTRTHNGKKYTVSAAHPAAEILPWLSDDELQALSDDIGAHGLRLKIVRLPDGRVVDGRNRELACRVAGVEPEYRDEDLDDDEVVALVLSRNLHRRHLDKSQRAMIAAELSTLRKPGRPSANSAPVQNYSRAQAAESLGVSERSVNAAAKVKSEAPELVESVKNGKLDVKTAAKVAALPKEKRKKVAKAADPKKAATAVLKSEPEDSPPADPADAFCDLLAGMCKELDQFGQRVAELKESPYGRFVHWQSARDQLKNARETLWGGKPDRECPYCKAAGEPQPKCRCCGGLGVCTKSSFKAGVAAVGGER